MFSHNSQCYVVVKIPCDPTDPTRHYELCECRTPEAVAAIVKGIYSTDKSIPEKVVLELRAECP